MTDSFFRRIDDRTFEATEHTRGPWSEVHQHGGPPAALVGRAMEAIGKEVGAPQPMRITVELLRPVPIARLSIAIEASAEGRAVRRIVASISSDGTEVMRAVGLFCSPRAVDVDAAPDTDPPPRIENVPTFTFPFFRAPIGYHTAMEGRYARGTIGRPKVFAWMRMRIPLVEGEAPSPLQRVLIAADSGNGVTAALDWRTHSFVNPDLTVALHRLPDGEWVGLDAEMRTEKNGVGLATTRLWDERGVLGRGMQTLLVRKY